MAADSRRRWSHTRTVGRGKSGNSAAGKRGLSGGKVPEIDVGGVDPSRASRRVWRHVQRQTDRADPPLIASPPDDLDAGRAGDCVAHKTR